MKKLSLAFAFLLLLSSCGSGKSFNSFFNDHKRDLGTTAFQVPNFMMTLVKNISPEINDLFGNVNDFKFITFSEISREKQNLIISEMNLVTDNNFTDILRSNAAEKTKIVSVRFANLIISLSLIDPAGCITAVTPDCTNFSMPSTNGKNASEAATTSSFKF